jgi:hypothetical protein
MTNGGHPHHAEKAKKASAKRTRGKSNGGESTTERLKKRKLLGDRVNLK